MDFIDIPKIKNFQPKKHSVRYIQEKMNGYFMEVYKTPEGINCYFKGRKENIWQKIKELPFAKNICNLPYNTVLFGELHCLNAPATSVITMLNEANPHLQFSPFALPLWKNENLSNKGYEEIDDILIQEGFKVPDWVERQFVDESICESLKKTAIKKKIEGYVLKKGHMKGWYKLKTEKTLDAFVIGHTISKSKTFNGSLKSFQVAVKGISNESVEVAKVSIGFNHQFKLTCKPREYYGKVMEVGFQDIASKGKLQFPKFLRWRDDKNKEGCLIEQLKF